MRIWSVHPKYLDSKGLVALWRETLLVKSVLVRNSKGYQNHPQLNRFKTSDNPINAIDLYLEGVWNEAKSRGYNFNKSKIDCKFTRMKIPVTEGQIKYEAQHLLNKLKIRDQAKYIELKFTQKIEVHPLFQVRSGDIEEWEKV